MRVLATIGIAALLVAGGAGLDAAGATTIAPTVKVVVRPVTTTGQVASGFTMITDPGGVVDCSIVSPSPVAVSANIEFCSPSAEYAVACWKAALAHHVLCMRDPRSNKVVRISRSGPFAATVPLPALRRAPLMIRLGDGDVCRIRDGGAWAQLPGHPDLDGTYSCQHDGKVWATASAPHEGVNESHPVWTVRTAHFGSSTLVTRHIVKAWFVGTFNH
jgi:hypothetical protein